MNTSVTFKKSSSKKELNDVHEMLWIILVVPQDNNVERAADWIFSHADELDVDDAPMDTGNQDAQTKFRDGAARKLLPFSYNEKQQYENGKNGRIL